jgi:hypothetical protein
MLKDDMREFILHNAEEINRLHSRIDQTFKERNKNEQKNAEWKSACEEFHNRYDELAFPGGWEGALDRIILGEPQSMEAALVFVECRPYFFRSGYMFKDILRKLKKAPLSIDQKKRLQVVQEKYSEYKKSKI